MDTDILQEAYDLVTGPRHQAYGPADESFTTTGRMWAAMLHLERDITPQEVAMMMVLHKIVRESYSPKRDNRVDMVGYTLLMDTIQTGEDT
jgi:hypothetical protein